MKKIDVEIKLDNASKKFINEWIFKNITFNFSSEFSYAIIGSNGSGKSTLLNTISGASPLSNGKICYEISGLEISADAIFKHIATCSPALELIEEFTLNEAIDFHRKFHLLDFESNTAFIEKIQLENQSTKQIKNFSSGMKQRLKLGFAFFSDVDILLLDEPTINLDEDGINWYLENVEKIKKEKLVIISSNQKYEYDFCDKVLNVVDYK